MQNISKINNFDLLRLLAALQVVIGHSLEHLQINDGFVFFIYNNLLKYFPGVPIFFFLSGFLIFWSFDRNQDLKNYFKNRLYRIYPALWVCFILTLILLFSFSSISILDFFKDKSFYFWLIGQLTFFRFYTPDIIRFWGVGTPNGSLWTIIVELQFYVLIPVIYFLIRKSKVFVLVIFLGSILINSYLAKYTNDSMFIKLSKLSVLPYLYYFLMGITFYLFYDKLYNFIYKKSLLWLFLFLTLSLIFNQFLHINTYSYWISNPYKLVIDVVLCFTIFSLAFNNVNVSNKLLNHNDISYGVYIYHMIIINAFVSIGFVNYSFNIIIVILIVVILSYLSWRFIEKPVLDLKKKSLNSQKAA